MAESVSSQSLVLGRYQLTDRVGTGSSGSVFAATDSQTGSEVVVKFFDGAEDGFPSWTSELRLVMRFKHPNIVPCLDAGFDEVHQLWALVFARAHGGSLRRALIAGTLRKEQHAQVLLNVASALVYAHSQGVIHRDVKPENIVAERDAWLLTDFGAGRFLSRGAVARTMTGSVEYMAPEVKLLGATPSSDQFSLGMIGAELCLGMIPSRQQLPHIRRTLETMNEVAKVIARLCEDEPQQRFADMEQALIALQEAVKQMDVNGSLWERLRPYLSERYGLTESALLQLHSEWATKGPLLEFLVRKQLLTRPQARTIDAIEKGYMDLPLSTVLGFGLRGSTPSKPAPKTVQRVAPEPARVVTDVSAKESVQESVQESAQESVQAVTKESVQESVQAVTKESVQESVQESATEQPGMQETPTPSLPPQRRLADLAPGMRIGRYLLQESLGSGATATVFRSFHEMLGVPVAVKVFEAIDLSADPDARSRFLREAQTLVRLDHPNIVRVFDADLQDRLPFIVMEHVGENSLEDLIAVTGKLQAPHIARIGLAVAEALEAAARGGLMHRDVKPSNIIERMDGHIKLVDFGIASRRTKDGVLEDPLAALGLVSGTATYIAPEQIENPSTIDFRADMYSLGATLYDAAVGRPPFERDSLRELLLAHIQEEPAQILELVPSFDRHLALVIHRMLRKKPEQRYGSWREVKDALSYLLLLHDKTHDKALDTASDGATDKAPDRPTDKVLDRASEETARPILSRSALSPSGSQSKPPQSPRPAEAAIDAPSPFAVQLSSGSAAPGTAVKKPAAIPAAIPAVIPAAISVAWIAAARSLLDSRTVRMTGLLFALCLFLVTLFLLLRSS